MSEQIEVCDTVDIEVFDTVDIEVFDTTLRDGMQVEGVSATVDDKLRIAEQLDWLGVDFIEAGWPGANPKDDELFRRAPQDLKLNTSTLVAFGSTRRVKGKVDSDDTLRHLVEANVGTVCIVGKSWDYHVLEALQTTLDEGEAMIADSVRFLTREGRRVMVAVAVMRPTFNPLHRVASTSPAAEAMSGRCRNCAEGVASRWTAAPILGIARKFSG